MTLLLMPYQSGSVLKITCEFTTSHVSRGEVMHSSRAWGCFAAVSKCR